MYKNAVGMLTLNIFGFALQNPAGGEWAVVRTVKRAWTQVNVTTQSLFDYSVEIVETKNDIFYTPVAGNLIKGSLFF